MESLLAAAVVGNNAFDISANFGLKAAMVHIVRNLGQPGIAAMAISAVDNALWDLKAKLLDVSILDLLGAARERAMIYGSGGFTSYSTGELQDQLGAWAAEGIKMVKMKIGRNPAADVERVRPLERRSGRRWNFSWMPIELIRESRLSHRQRSSPNQMSAGLRSL